MLSSAVACFAFSAKGDGQSQKKAPLARRFGNTSRSDVG
jgi:hypothetical protein